MTESALNIFLRVIRRRLEKGEHLENILASYPKLSDEEKEMIKEKLELQWTLYKAMHVLLCIAFIFSHRNVWRWDNLENMQIIEQTPATTNKEKEHIGEILFDIFEKYFE